MKNETVSKGELVKVLENELAYHLDGDEVSPGYDSLFIEYR